MLAIQKRFPIEKATVVGALSLSIGFFGMLAALNIIDGGPVAVTPADTFDGRTLQKGSLLGVSDNESKNGDSSSAWQTAQNPQATSAPWNLARSSSPQAPSSPQARMTVPAPTSTPAPGMGGGSVFAPSAPTGGVSMSPDPSPTTEPTPVNTSPTPVPATPLPVMPLPIDPITDPLPLQVAPEVNSVIESDLSL